MSPRARLALAVVAGLALIVATSVVFAAVAVYHDGTVAVDVRNEEGTLSLRLPASLVRAAAACVPSGLRGTISSDLGEARSFLPALRAACQSLSRSADGVLVEVVDSGESVRVIKRGRVVVVDVAADDATVRVSVPLSAFEDVVAAVERLEPGLEVTGAR
jgi:hypothetical protein